MKWIITLVALNGAHVDHGDFAKTFFQNKQECEKARAEIDFLAIKMNPNAPESVRTECRLSEDLL